MASYVITRSGGTIKKTYFKDGKPSSSITVNNRTGKVITSSKNYRSDRIAELEKKDVDRAIASQISLAESKGQKFAQITPEIARQLKKAEIKSPSFKQADVVRLAQEKFQIKRKNTFEGNIKGNYYSNLTKEELENNRLAKNTRAIFQPSRTRLIQGRGTSRDLFNVLAKDKKQLDIIKTRSSALKLIDIQNKIRGQKVGTVQGKVYAQLSREEILNNKLNPNSNAILLSSKSSIRQNYKNVADSLRNLYQGNATSRDILTILSKGTGLVNIIKTKRMGRQLVSAVKRRQEIKEAKRKEEQRKIALKGLSKREKENIEKYAEAVEQRTKSSFQKIAERESKIVVNKIARGEFIDLYSPKLLKSSAKNLNKVITLGEKVFTGLLNYGASLASLGDKAIFLIPALGANVKSGRKDVALFFKGFTTKEQVDQLKKIYTDPKTYRDALVGAGLSVILGGFKEKPKTTKVENLPPKAYGFERGTVLIDKKGGLGVVGRKGTVINIPKNLQSQITKGRITPQQLAKLTPKRLKALNRQASGYVNSNKGQLSKLQKEFVEVSKRLLRSKKAQARKGRRPSKAEIRRKAFGLGKKQGKLRVDKGEFVQKAPKKGGIEESVRFNPRTGKTTLVRKSKNAKLEMSVDKAGQVKDSQLTVGKGEPITLGGKGFKRPPSQVKTRTGDIKNFDVLVIQNKGLFTKMKLQRYEQNLKKIVNSLKDPKFIEKKGVVTKIIKKTKSLTAKDKRLIKKFAQEVNLKQKDVVKGYSQGRARVVNRILERAKQKQKQFHSTKIDNKRLPKIKVEKKIKSKSLSTVKRELGRVKRDTLAVNNKISNILARVNKFDKLSVALKNSFKSALNSAIKSLFNINSRLVGLSLGLVKGSAFDNDVSIDSINKQAIDIDNTMDQTDRLITKIKKINDKIKKKTPKDKKLKRTKRPVRKAPTPTKQLVKIKKEPVKPKVPKKPKRPKKTKAPAVLGFPAIPLNLLAWNKKLPKGYRYLVNGYIRIRGKKVLVAKGLPKNKAWNRVYVKGTKLYRSVDNSTPRSFEFKIVGVTKAKDDPKRLRAYKVRPRVGKDPKVLLAVEKSKYSLDSKGEKNELSIYKKVKRNAKKN